MIEDEENGLSRMMRMAFGSVGEPALKRDLWPDVVRRIHEQPRLSRADSALLAAVLLFGLLFPQSLLFLLYAL
jgi:hypothetical protein